MAKVNGIKQNVLGRRGRYTVIRDNLHAKEVVVGEGGRRRRYTSSATTRKKLSGRKSIENRKSDSLKKDLKDTPPGKPTPNGLSNFRHLPAINGIFAYNKEQ